MRGINTTPKTILMKFLPQTLQQVLSCILLLVLSIGSGFFFWNARLLLRESKESAINIRSTTASIDEYVKFQTEQFQSPAYQKYMKGNFAVGSLVQSVVEGVNTKTLPKLNKGLDELPALIQGLSTNTRTLNELVLHLDSRLNSDSGLLAQATTLLASLTATSDKFGLTLETLDAAIKVIAEKAGLSLDEVLNLIASKEWLSVLRSMDVAMANVAAMSQKVDATAEQIRLAMEKAPSIADSLNRIAKTSSKFTKATLIANIIGVLAKAFLP